MHRIVMLASALFSTFQCWAVLADFDRALSFSYLLFASFSIGRPARKGASTSPFPTCPWDLTDFGHGVTLRSLDESPHPRHLVVVVVRKHAERTINILPFVNNSAGFSRSLRNRRLGSFVESSTPLTFSFFLSRLRPLFTAWIAPSNCGYSLVLSDRCSGARYMSALRYSVASAPSRDCGNMSRNHPTTHRRGCHMQSR
ncbi:hypothetical protein B0H67DRAFT_2318 [Lasiosphaeris hirsuta]|uniref:Secreted protein n=1 Tax=Lasiosphaeris hirsuta TaxID=260670 RepID=A0AA40B8F1_9PEZI|nr:hypothetical protein B0H67DRAFT_2318 [Lasiosphaeris hirsuta]